MSSCSVVMVSYHTGPVLFAAVKNVLAQEKLSELIVVDNGNPPDVLARLQQMTLGNPRLKIITGRDNGGYAKACNLGAGQASGDFILMLNPDCLLPPEALSDMMAAFDDVPGAMLAGARMQHINGSEQLTGRRALPTPKSMLMEMVGLGRFAKHKQVDSAVPGATCEVEAVSGSFMMLRQRDFDQLGGFDGDFFLEGEEIDLCLRVRQAGGKVIFVPRVPVTHMQGSGAKSSLNFLEWQKAKGFTRYFHKHFKKQLLLLPLVDGLLAVHFALTLLVANILQFVAPKLLLKHSAAAKRLMVLASGLELPVKKDWDGKTVLVTGATSQVGLSVVRRLIASGAAVLAVSRNEPIPYRHKHLRWIKGDLTDNALHLHGYLADVIVHCAPLWHLPPIIDLLADAEVKRVIAFGSTSIFGKALSRNRHEKELVVKFTYAENEIAARCGARGMAWTLLRPTVIYGVGLDVGITSLAKFIDRCGFAPVFLRSLGKRQPVHADDLAIAVMQCAGVEGTYGKAYNLSGGEIVTYREMLERIFSLLRRKIRVLNIPMLPILLDLAGLILNKQHINGEIARRMNDDLVFFHDDAARDFNFHPRRFLTGGMKDLEGF